MYMVNDIVRLAPFMESIISTYYLLNNMFTKIYRVKSVKSNVTTLISLDQSRYHATISTSDNRFMLTGSHCEDQWVMVGIPGHVKYDLLCADSNEFLCKHSLSTLVYNGNSYGHSLIVCALIIIQHHS